MSSVLESLIELTNSQVSGWVCALADMNVSFGTLNEKTEFLSPLLLLEMEIEV